MKLTRLALGVSCVVCFMVLASGKNVNASTDSEEDGEPDSATSRLLDNELRLSGLHQRIETLRERLKALKKEGTLRKLYRIIKWRVERLEGTNCDETEFACGWRSHECVPNFFVCDGIKDCSNGLDETDALCNTSKIRAGMSIKGCSALKKSYGSGGRLTLCYRGTFTSVIQHQRFKNLFYVNVTGYYYVEGTTQLLTRYALTSVELSSRKWISASTVDREGRGPVIVSECFFTDEDFDEVICFAAREGISHSYRDYGITATIDKTEPRCTIPYFGG